MNVVSHRSISAVPPAIAPTIDMPGLSRMLGIDFESATSRRHTSPKTRIAYVQMLIETMNFPGPLPHYGKDETGAPALIKEIRYSKSRWLRAPVDAWLNGTIPPHMLAAIDEQEADAATDRLTAAAEAMAS